MCTVCVCMYFSLCLCYCKSSCVCFGLCICVHGCIKGLFYSSFVHCNSVLVSQTNLISLILLGFGHY